jgi:hypothetical protein
MAATDKKGARPAVKHLSINLSVNSSGHTARLSTENLSEEAKAPQLNVLPSQSMEEILSKLISGDQ